MVNVRSMDFLLPGQRERLDRWSSRRFSRGSESGPTPRDLRLNFERHVGSEQPGPPLADGPHARVAGAILCYRVFPQSIVRGVLARSPVEPGDTVGISYQLFGGLRLFFACRVVATQDADDGQIWRTGFTYRTLAGHPELGEESFLVEKDLVAGTVRVALRSWSRAGTWLARIGSPVMRLAQRRASEGALDCLASVATR
jgi:uncharacterized protein (UPF0548 family)